jgi:AcrR family transcriptional regulator
MAPEKLSTRDRILEECRRLFNERGPAEVTTAEIASAVGISEGNLHYHFRRKEQIVEALFGAFEQALERVAVPEREWETRSDAHRVYTANWFNLIWEWRFLYGASVYRLAPSLQPRLRRITDAGQAHVRQFVHGLVSTGVLTGTERDIDRLVINAWIVGTYWIDYLRSRQGVQTVTRQHLRWGLAQVEALFTPYAVASSTPKTGPREGEAPNYGHAH